MPASPRAHGSLYEMDVPLIVHNYQHPMLSEGFFRHNFDVRGSFSEPSRPNGGGKGKWLSKASVNDQCLFFRPKKKIPSRLTVALVPKRN